jgi:hypothetical protein
MREHALLQVLQWRGRERVERRANWSGTLSRSERCLRPLRYRDRQHATAAALSRRQRGSGLERLGGGEEANRMRCRTRTRGGRLGHAGPAVEGGDEGGNEGRIAHAAPAEVTMASTKHPRDGMWLCTLRRRRELLIGRSSSRSSSGRQYFRKGGRGRARVARARRGALVEREGRPARGGGAGQRRWVS